MNLLQDHFQRFCGGMCFRFFASESPFSDGDAGGGNIITLSL